MNTEYRTRKDWKGENGDMRWWEGLVFKFPFVILDRGLGCIEAMYMNHSVKRSFFLGGDTLTICTLKRALG
jgi:hypothetical protein